MFVIVKSKDGKEYLFNARKIELNGQKHWVKDFITSNVKTIEMVKTANPNVIINDYYKKKGE